MSKSIADYLHLYLGCKVMFNNKEYYLEGFQGHGLKYGGNWIFIMNDADDSHWVSVKDIKPILRNLTDMTEEEAQECWKLCDGAKNGNYGVTNPKCALTDYTFHSDLNPHQWFVVTKFFLSKNFDLFQLHKQGLCLYKSDLK